MQFIFNSPSLFSGAKDRIKEILALSLICFSICLILALLTYNAGDQSWNTASSPPISNLMGAFGSYASDVMLQSFGITSFLWIGIFAIWAGRLITDQAFVLSWWRLLCALLGTVGTGITIMPFAALNKLLLYNMPLLGDLPAIGGFISLLLSSKLMQLLNGQRIWMVWIALGAIGVTSFLSLWISVGYTLRQLTYWIVKIYNSIIILSIFIGTHIYHLYAWIHKKHFPNTPLPILEEDVLGHALVHGPTVEFESIEITGEEENNAFAWPHFWPSEALKASEKESSTEDSFENTSSLAPTPLTTNKKSKKPFFSHIFQAGEYVLPPVDILDKTLTIQTGAINREQLNEQAQLLEEVLAEFGVKGEIVNIRPGPVVTMYELKPAPGIKTNRVVGLADDIARSMSALSARIAVIQGQNVIGIELPNKTRQTVYLREQLNSAEYKESGAALPLILGQNIGGAPVIVDLVKMPHLLVAGTTGSGKSVSVNAMILSLLFKLKPSECKFIMIDPKMLELSVYDDIPHLLTPVVTDPKKAIVALKWAVKEMENRYRAMSALGVRGIEGFNKRLKEAKQSGETLVRRVQTGFDPETGKPIFENQGLDYEPLPFIVVVVDEMADLMLVAGKEIEATIQRLAQMARAAGIHLIMATQRPSVDVITGTIKANFPTRISFQVTSKIDSRTILGEQGAEQLLGQGDMLYMAGGGRINRVHGPFVKDDEVERIVSFLKEQGEPDYIDGVTDDEEEENSGAGTPNSDKGADATYTAAVNLIKSEGKVSISFVQRHLQIGYNRAARIIEQMEKEGIISAASHTGKREIL